MAVSAAMPDAPARDTVRAGLAFAYICLNRRWFDLKQSGNVAGRFPMSLLDIGLAGGIRRQHPTVSFPFTQRRQISRAVFFSLNSNDPLLGHALIIGQDSPD